MNLCMWLMCSLPFGNVPDVPGLPGVAALEQVALRKLGFDEWDYSGARDRLRARHWLPSVTVRFSASSWDRASVADDVSTLDLRRSGYSGEVSATWHLSGIAYDDHEIALAREHVQVQRTIGETLARVRADVAAYRTLSEEARGGNAASRETLLALRQALLGGRTHVAN